MMRRFVPFVSVLLLVSGLTHAEEGQRADRNRGGAHAVPSEEPATPQHTNRNHARPVPTTEEPSPEHARRDCARPYVGDMKAPEIDALYVEIERLWAKRLTQG